jgi:hypothetical protein
LQGFGVRLALNGENEMANIRTLMIEKTSGQWDGMVMDGDAVLTVGSMPTREELATWLDDAVARKVWLDGSELPDMYDSRVGFN